MDARLVRPEWRGRTNVDAFTIACIEHAEQIVRDEAPQIAHLFDVTQGSYQGDSGDPDSGTTHRLGGGVDLGWCGHPVCYSALRLAGMFIWHRDPSQGDWADHFHGAPIGHPFMDARLAAQETSYLAGGDGIGGRDTGPRFNPIPQPVWPYPPEDDMPYTDWPEKDRTALVNDLRDALLTADVGGDLKVKAALRMAAKAPSLARELERLITESVVAAVPGSDPAAIEAAVLSALRKGTG